MSGPETGKKGSECVSCCRVSSSESVRFGKETDIIILHFDFRMTATVWIDKDKVCLQGSLDDSDSTKVVDTEV